MFAKDTKFLVLSDASQSYQGWSTFSCKPSSLDIILEPIMASVHLLPSALVLGIVPEVVTGVGVSEVPIAVTVTIIVKVEALVTSVSLKTVDISAGETSSIIIHHCKENRVIVSLHVFVSINVDMLGARVPVYFILGQL